MTTPTNPPSADPRWRLVVGVTPVLLAVLLYRVFAASTATLPEAPRPAAGAGVVAVAVERPDAPRREFEVAWVEGQTVADATRRATATEWRGSGEMALLESLEGVTSQGADGLNWQFEVNGEYATRGAGAVRLDPGDRVLWKLAPYE